MSIGSFLKQPYSVKASRSDDYAFPYILRIGSCHPMKALNSGYGHLAK